MENARIMAIDLVDEELWLPKELVQIEIANEIARHYPNETGGMLLGYINGSHRVVTAGISAGPNAQRSPSHMVPDDQYQQKILLEHFQRTDGKESFLGEWHSHPEAAPRMSMTDRRTLQRVTVESENLLALPVMLIVAIYAREERSQLRAYRRRDASRRAWLNLSHFVEISIRGF